MIMIKWWSPGNDHLAVCDETSLVKPDDYIVTDFFDKAYRCLTQRIAINFSDYYDNDANDDDADDVDDDDDDDYGDSNVTK